MKKSANLDLKTILPALKKFQKQLAAHLMFIAVMLVLLAYVFMVWQIKVLANAEPSPDAQAANDSTSAAPTIDSAAIKQIQTLEQNNPDVHTLFESARDNPFQD